MGCCFYVPFAEFARIDNTGVWAGSSCGYELIDHNPNTWVAMPNTNALTARMQINVGVATAGLEGNVWGGLYVFNQYDMRSDGGSIVIQSADAGYANPTTQATLFFSSFTERLVVGTFGGSSRQYWQFVIDPGSVIPKVALAFVGTYRELATRWDFGNVDSEYFAVQQSELTPGRRPSRLLSSKPLLRTARNFQFLTSDEIIKLRWVFENVYGGHAPFIYVDDTMDVNLAPQNGRLCRFLGDSLGETEVTFGLWQAGVSIEEVAQPAWGGSY